MEFKITDALIPLSNTSNQQSGPEDNSLEDECEVAEALVLLSENVKITQSGAEEAILAALTLAKFRGRCYCEKEIREVLGDTFYTSKALRKLLAEGKVKRSGKGGRQQPYIYSLP